MITNTMLIKIVQNMCRTIQDNKVYLTELDTAIGDSDHGFNMNKGFKAVSDKLESVNDKDCGTILKTVAMTLISTVGGASGPLFGTAFLKAGAVVNGKFEIDSDDIIKMYEAAIQGISDRGKAKKGDKTILDALIPAYEAFRDAIEQEDDLVVASDKAHMAAFEGVAFTETIVATKGRASYLGERSVGHQDPGATSCYLMLKSITDTLKGDDEK